MEVSTRRSQVKLDAEQLLARLSSFMDAYLVLATDNLLDKDVNLEEEVARIDSGRLPAPMLQLIRVSDEREISILRRPRVFSSKNYLVYTAYTDTDEQFYAILPEGADPLDAILLPPPTTVDAVNIIHNSRFLAGVARHSGPKVREILGKILGTRVHPWKGEVSVDERDLNVLVAEIGGRTLEWISFYAYPDPFEWRQLLLETTFAINLGGKRIVYPIRNLAAKPDADSLLVLLEMFGGQDELVETLHFLDRVVPEIMKGYVLRDAVQ